MELSKVFVVQAPVLFISVPRIKPFEGTDRHIIFVHNGFMLLALRVH